MESAAAVLVGIGLIRRLAGTQGSPGNAIRRQGSKVADKAGALTSSAGQLTGEAVGLAGRSAGAMVAVTGMAASEALGMMADGATVVLELAVRRAPRVRPRPLAVRPEPSGHEQPAMEGDAVDIDVPTTADQLLVNEVLADEGLAGPTSTEEGMPDVSQPGEALASEALGQEGLGPDSTGGE